ncbi:hypothetical protein H0H92_004508 [Tricholoma furcatifolium]|nr:hypothetical protein H0H92_004508 [Tricholoma furcatifolium]
MHIIIRPLTTADIPKVRALHSSLLPVNYPTSFFIQLTLLTTRVCLVAYDPADPNSPVAFISAALQHNSRVNALLSNAELEKPHIEILTLGVLPAYQQKGIARLLVQNVYHYLRNHSPSPELTDNTVIHTNVATSNVPALSFYERIGMQIATGVIRNLYRACPHGSKDGYLLVGRISS